MESCFKKRGATVAPASSPAASPRLKKTGPGEFHTTSLGIFSVKNPIRAFCIKLACWKWFDRFILFIVLANTGILGIVDYTDPWDEGPNPTKLRNQIVDMSNFVSLMIFLVEAVIKIIALGFIRGSKTYLSDNWNRLDFVVLLTGVLSFFNVSSKLNMLRVLRVLRPLRTLHALPGLRILVNSLMDGLPALLNVGILLLFGYSVFAILGMEIWRGTYHYRCRLTDFPVRLPFNASDAPQPGMYPNQTYINMVLVDPHQFRCAQDLNLTEQSAWPTPQNCFWPIDYEDTQYCGYRGSGRDCKTGRTCGSNYDLLGEPKFYDIYFNGTLDFPLMTEPDYLPDLNYGLTSFDNIAATLVIVLQVVTASAWMALTQNSQDAYSWMISGIYFNALLFIGMCFMLQLNMAVIFSEFEKAKEAQARLLLKEMEQHLKEIQQQQKEVQNGSNEKTESSRSAASISSRAKAEHVEALAGNRGVYRKFQAKVRIVVKSPYFRYVGLVLTLGNTIVLACDHHPMDMSFRYGMEVANFSFMLFFCVEIIVKMIGLGVGGFFKDSFNKFDFLTIIMGFVEVITNPPTFIDGTPGGAGPFTALRAVRVLKLARNWESLSRMLRSIMNAMGEILNFLFFLVLFIYVYALIGMELFATKYKFDGNNYPRPFNSTDPTVTLHRSNFDSVHWAFFTVFQIITYDNFPAVMYDGWLSTGWGAPIYFTSIIVLGVWIVMNMFSAILVNSCISDDDGDDDSGDDNRSVEEITISKIALTKARLARKAFRSIVRHHVPIARAFFPEESSRYGSQASTREDGTETGIRSEAMSGTEATTAKGLTTANMNLSTGQEVVAAGQLISPTTPRRASSTLKTGAGASTLPPTTPRPGPDTARTATTDISRRDAASHASRSTQREKFYGRSLFLFPVNNPIRKLCIFIIRRREWSIGVNLLIALSCVIIALDTPLLDPDQGLGYVVSSFNRVFAILFLVEMIISVIAHGFLFGRNSYLSDGWRILDFFIVVVSLGSLVSDATGGSASNILSGLRALRSLRALRPLRVINKLPQLRLVVNTLFRCLPDILKALLFFMFMLFLFGIITVIYFKGALSSCSISPYNYQTNLKPNGLIPPWWLAQDYQGNFTMDDIEIYDFMTFPRAWQNMPKDWRDFVSTWNQSCKYDDEDFYNPAFRPTSKQVCLCFAEQNQTTWDQVVPQSFDNIFIAVGSLYELTSMEGWSAVAFASVDSRGEPDMQPITNYNETWMIFWIMFMIVCAFFITNLFIGVLCESFMRENYGGTLITEEQIKWVKLHRKVLTISPIEKPQPPNGGKIRLWCFNIVNFTYFDHGITLCILVNMVCMAAQYYGQSESYSAVLEKLNLTFVAIFSMECVLKVITYGFPKYISDAWNKFDFFIVLLSLGSIIVSASSDDIEVGPVATVVRVFRVGRALRLINKADIMRNLFETLLVSLPAVGNVTSLLMLLFYIYSAVGVQLFAKVAFNDDMINSHQNFQTFWLALQTLIGFSTGENYDNYLWEVYNTVPDSNPTCEDREFNASVCGFNTTEACVPLDGCGTWLVIPYFYSFYLVVGYVAMNLFSGIVVDAIGDASDDCPVNGRTLMDFTEMWSLYDPGATCVITVEQLCDLLYTSYPPFGFKGIPTFTRRKVLSVIGQLSIPIINLRYVHFKDVSRILVQRILSEGNMTKLKDMHDIMDKLGFYKEFEEVWRRKLGGKRSSSVAVEEQVFPIKTYTAGVIILNFLRRLQYARKKRKMGLPASSRKMSLKNGEVVDQNLPSTVKSGEQNADPSSTAVAQTGGSSGIVLPSSIPAAPGTFASASAPNTPAYKNEQDLRYVSLKDTSVAYRKSSSTDATPAVLATAPAKTSSGSHVKLPSLQLSSSSS